MRRFLLLVRYSVWRQVLSWSGAWWFVVELVLAQAVTPLLGLFVWLQIPAAGLHVGTYYLAVMAVALMTASFENHTFAQSIYSGDVVSALLQPQPVVIGPFGENLAIRIWMILLGIPLIAVVAVSIGVHFSLLSILVAIPALGMAAILRFLFTWTLATAAFWTERVHSVANFGGVLIFLLGGSAAPIALLPGPLATVARLLPFRSMLGFPAELAAGGLSAGAAVQGYGVTLAWLGIFGGAAIFAWRAGIRHYTSVGA
ncbi:MAG TPA: ABC-2 family transporter protein [Mycobacteriales bacterium]|nr:ABC-2 family transporter protein [Mycobacteriales bacterium]